MKYSFSEYSPYSNQNQTNRNYNDLRSTAFNQEMQTKINETPNQPWATNPNRYVSASNNGNMTEKKPQTGTSPVTPGTPTVPRSTMPATPATPGTPMTPRTTMPTTPTQPTMPGTPTMPRTTMPTTPTKPTMPGTTMPRTTMPTTPTQPTMPGTPTMPRTTMPTTPTQPTMPGTPTMPRTTMPTTPTKPTMPGTTMPRTTMPTTPTQPTMPGTTMAPRTTMPTMPTMPGTQPIMPGTTTTPRITMPTTPTMPTIPGTQPTMPGSPTVPTMPITPGTQPTMPRSPMTTTPKEQTSRFGNSFISSNDSLPYNNMDKYTKTSYVNPYDIPMSIPMLPLYGFDNVDDADKDWEYIKHMYPLTAKKIHSEIEEECDKLEYEGSCMFDVYPERVYLDRIVDRIYEKVKYLDEDNTDRVEMKQYPYHYSNDHDEHHDHNHHDEHDHHEHHDHNNLFRNFIEVLLFNEILNRRRRFRSRRRFY